MKRILAIGLFCSLGLSVWAAPQTLTGQISDGMCGKSHAGMGDMGKNTKDCTIGCVKPGGKYVFVSGEKITMAIQAEAGPISSALVCETRTDIIYQHVAHRRRNHSHASGSSSGAPPAGAMFR